MIRNPTYGETLGNPRENDEEYVLHFMFDCIVFVICGCVSMCFSFLVFNFCFNDGRKLVEPMGKLEAFGKPWGEPGGKQSRNKRGTPDTFRPEPGEARQPSGEIPRSPQSKNTPLPIPEKGPPCECRGRMPSN